MQRHANPDGFPQCPRLVSDGFVQLNCRGGGRRGPFEDRKRRVALAACFDQPSATRRDDLFDELVVASECHRHRVGVGLPCGRRSLDVGEQKCHCTHHRWKVLCDSNIQRCILCHDRGFEPPKLRSGIHPQLVGEHRPSPLIGA